VAHCERIERVPHRLHRLDAVVPHQIEAEAVNLVLLGPGDHGVDHHPLRHGVLGGDVLAARGRLDPADRVESVVVARHDTVEDRLVVLAARRGVVEHLVEDHLQPVGVQCADHGAELHGARGAVWVHVWVHNVWVHGV